MKTKNTSFAIPNKWMLVVAFVSALLPFTGLVNSATDQSRRPIKTELVVSKKTSFKERTVSFSSAFRQSTQQTFSIGSLVVGVRNISRMHSRDVAVVRKLNDKIPDDRLCCCYPKIISFSSDEDPFLFS
jgi:hypothetical protein